MKVSGAQNANNKPKLFKVAAKLFQREIRIFTLGALYLRLEGEEQDEQPPGMFYAEKEILNQPQTSIKVLKDWNGVELKVCNKGYLPEFNTDGSVKTLITLMEASENE